MKITLRKETLKDHTTVQNLVEEAFRSNTYSDQTEQFLVERLRKSNTFISDLSIVAELNGEIIGHIMVTKISIRNDEKSFESLSLAPVSVKPECQRKGIGRQLIIEAHRVAREMRFKSIIVLGHENYYPKFGYELASKYNIKLPFDAPDKNCMIIELEKNGLEGVSGTAEYPKVFFE